jgi:hypothetical protein
VSVRNVGFSPGFCAVGIFSSPALPNYCVRFRPLNVLITRHTLGSKCKHLRFFCYPLELPKIMCLRRAYLTILTHVYSRCRGVVVRFLMKKDMGKDVTYIQHHATQRHATQRQRKELKHISISPVPPLPRTQTHIYPSPHVSIRKPGISTVCRILIYRLLKYTLVVLVSYFTFLSPRGA